MSQLVSESFVVRAYRRVEGIRAPEDVIGYWLFALGAVAAAIAIGVFLYSSTLGEYSAPRQISVVLSSVGLTFLMLGVVHRLGASRRARYAAYLGAGITLLAIAWFVRAYPADWAAGADHSASIIAVYAVGIGLVVAAAIATPSPTHTSTDGSERSAPEAGPDRSATLDDAGQESIVTETAPADPSAAATYELFEDIAGEWRWRLRHQNGNIIADSGEGYHARSGALEAIDRVRGYAETADTPTIETGAFDLFKDRAGEWRWRLLAPNGLIIADGGEGYTTRTKATQGVESVRRNAPIADVEVLRRETSEPSA